MPRPPRGSEAWRIRGDLELALCQHGHPTPALNEVLDKWGRRKTYKVKKIYRWHIKPQWRMAGKDVKGANRSQFDSWVSDHRHKHYPTNMKPKKAKQA